MSDQNVRLVDFEMDFPSAPLWCSSNDAETDSDSQRGPQDGAGPGLPGLLSRKMSTHEIIGEQHAIIQTLQGEVKELKQRMEDLETVQTAQEHEQGMDEGDDDDGEGRTRPIDRLYEKADESYYFRVQTMILYNAVTPRLVFHFCNVCLCICLQIIALQTVWQSIWIPAGFEMFAQDDTVYPEEEFFPAGISYPTNFNAFFQYYNHTDIDKVENITILPLFFCVVMITLSTRSDINECKAGYVLVQSEVKFIQIDETKRVKGRGSIVDTIKAKSQIMRMMAVTFIHLLRCSLIWYFYDVSAQILGTSDGPFNLLLNSLAMVFVLDLDNVIYFDMPSKNFFGVEDPYLKKRYLRRLKVARQIFRDAYHTCQNAPKYVNHLYHSVAWFYLIGTSCALFIVGFKMQHYTTSGKLVTIDDDAMSGTKHPDLTKLYNWSMYVLLFWILVDVQTVAFVASWDRPHSKVATFLRLFANFAFEGLALIVFRQLILRYVLGCLIPYSYSMHTWPIHFWDRVDPAPNRPDNEYAYGYYDYGDYGADAGYDYET